MKITETPLQDLLIIEPTVFPDERGYFYESYQDKRYKDLTLPHFVQDNISYSKKNVLRGLHYQLPHAQGKLVNVLRGSVLDVAVDIRKSSKTFGQWFSVILDDQNHKQLYVPEGFAHGFCVLSDEAVFMYKCSDYYHHESSYGIIWNDKNLAIDWPIQNPILAKKDQTFPSLNEIPHDKLFA